MYTDDDLLPISGLAHLEFCARRCALVHLEGIWGENLQTAQGRLLHQRVHEAPSGMAGQVRVARGLRLRSLELGLSGVADVVEFHPLEDADESGAVLPGRAGRWRPYPVEYKRGRRKSEKSYFVQLCAQALCLEEMLDTEVPAGALYHGKSRHRQPVEFDAALRETTRRRARQFHELIAGREIPAAEHGPKCRFCSLAGQCLPKLPRSRSARRHVARTIDHLLSD